MSQDVNKPACEELASQYDEEVNLSPLCRFDLKSNTKTGSVLGGQDNYLI